MLSKKNINVDNKDHMVFLLATLPRSGTWYSMSFFWVFFEMLRGWPLSLLRVNRRYLAKAIKTPHIEITKTSIPFGDKLLLKRATEKNNIVFVCHSICPGYYESQDPLYSEWKKLQFRVPDCNYGEGLMGEYFSKALNPYVDQDAKIVYFYRDPLEQLNSFYQHTLNHINPEQRKMTAEGGGSREINCFEQFIFDAYALESYIKQTHTFFHMHSLFPENILLCHFDQLKSNPQAVFTRVLSHFNFLLDTKISQRAFQRALQLSQKGSLSWVEDKIGRSLAGDQLLGDESHLRNKTKHYSELNLSSDVIERIEQKLSEFNL